MTRINLANTPLPNAGETINASDLRGPILQIIGVINGNLTTDNFNPSNRVSSNILSYVDDSIPWSAIRPMPNSYIERDNLDIFVQNAAYSSYMHPDGFIIDGGAITESTVGQTIMVTVADLHLMPAQDMNRDGSTKPLFILEKRVVLVASRDNYINVGLPSSGDEYRVSNVAIDGDAPAFDSRSDQLRLAKVTTSATGVTKITTTGGDSQEDDEKEFSPQSPTTKGRAWEHEFSGFTVDDITVTAHYKKTIEQIVHFKLSVDFNTAPTRVSNQQISFKLPFNSLPGETFNSSVIIHDVTGRVAFRGALYRSGVRTADVRVFNSPSNFGQLATPTQAQPTDWDAGVNLSISGSYLIA